MMRMGNYLRLANENRTRSIPVRSMPPRARTWTRWLPVLLMLAAVNVSMPSRLRAQSIFEVTPYQIQVWVVMQPHPQVAPAWQQQLTEELEQLVESRVGAPWTLQSAPVPDPFRYPLLADELPAMERILEHDSSLGNRDKLMVVTLAAERDGFRMSVRELDFATRNWSAASSRLLANADRLAWHAADLLCRQFVPIVRIEQIEDASVVASERAGALVRPENSERFWQSPVSVTAGELLQPVIRRADRNGVVRADGIKPIDWTVLVVEGRDSGGIKCRFESGYRQPFSTRRSSRVEQLALVVKPHWDATILRLVNRSAPDEPLVGYTVYAKRPDSEEPEFLGRTDWQGEMKLEASAEKPVQVLFVRNGQQLLGKLPVVPGAERLLVAPLRNDDLRLEAEGFLIGVQDSLVDLVARREVLAVRIRRHLEAGELDKAEELLRDLRRLDTQDDFARRVQQRRQALTSEDPQVQQKIDQLFAQTRGLLGRYLSQEQVDELNQALATAQRSRSSGS